VTGWRTFSLLLPALLASCGGPGRQAVGPTPAAAVCRVGPDGGPIDASFGVQAGKKTAERGIGGTGVTNGPGLADRGIGGTGIVGIITGFASICVDGLEVGIEPSTPVRIGDSPASASALRAGQLVVVTAHGPSGMLRASDVAVRFEVSGPVQRVEASGSRLVVAGQSVTVPAGLRGAELAPGRWVSVSGFRTSDGDIAATRIDPRQPGTVSAHGQVGADGGGLRMGDLALRFAGKPTVRPGEFVQVSGQLAGGVLGVEAVTPDLLATDPPARFGPNVDRLVIQSFTSVLDGRVRLGPAFEADTAAGLAPAGLASALHVVEFDRAPGGHFLATGLRASAGPGSAILGPAWTPAGPATVRPDRAFTPAPVPNGARMPPGTGGFPREETGSRPPFGGPRFGPGGAAPGFGCPPGEACHPGRGAGGPPPPAGPPPFH